MSFQAEKQIICAKDLPSPSDWALGSLAVGPKTKTIPNREVISGLILRAIIDSVKPSRIHFGDRPQGFAKGGLHPTLLSPRYGNNEGLFIGFILARLGEIWLIR